MEKGKTHKTVLIAPLDWGLGHATRCIPIINYFVDKGWIVTIGCPAGSAHQALLQREFPALRFVPILGYSVEYAHSRKYFLTKMFTQIPKIWRSIRLEHYWLNDYVKENQLDLIFSDNRYGLYHKKVPSILMTHQLEIIFSNKFVQRNAQKLYYRFINRFSQCWVPDYKENGLAETLSHPVVQPQIPVYYIGPLSRLGVLKVADPSFLFLILLSGPEPQRTLLEEKMLDVIGRLPGKVLLVRGLPHQNSLLQVPDNCTVMNHLENEDMKKAFAVSQYIISRSGYTTIMEILSWQKKSILIPTPGQSEQEYIGAQLMKQHYAYVFEQEASDYLGEFLSAMQFDYHLEDFLPIYQMEITKALQELW